MSRKKRTKKSTTDEKKDLPTIFHSRKIFEGSLCVINRTVEKITRRRSPTSIVKLVQFVSDITPRKQSSCTLSSAATRGKRSNGLLQTRLTLSRRHERHALRHRIHPRWRRPAKRRFPGGELLRRLRIRRFLSQTVQQPEQRAVKTVQVRGRDVLVPRQARSWDHTVGVEVTVCVPQHALVVPYDGLCLVGAAAGYLGGCGGDAVPAGGGGDVGTAEEEAAGDVYGLPQAHEGLVGVGACGGVGGERIEEDLEVCLEYVVGIVGCVVRTVVGVVGGSCWDDHAERSDCEEGCEEKRVVEGHLASMCCCRCSLPYDGFGLWNWQCIKC